MTPQSDGTPGLPSHAPHRAQECQRRDGSQPGCRRSPSALDVTSAPPETCTCRLKTQRATSTAVLLGNRDTVHICASHNPRSNSQEAAQEARANVYRKMQFIDLCLRDGRPLGELGLTPATWEVLCSHIMLYCCFFAPLKMQSGHPGAD